MSIFEIIGEIVNPGKIGELDFKGEGNSPRKKFIILRFLISLLLIAAVEYLLLVDNMHYNDWTYVIRVNAILLVYCFIGYKVQVRPNTENMGWVPFIIDNPFRISDDANRFMVVIKLLFMPGKYIATNIRDFYRHKKAERR